MYLRIREKKQHNDVFIFDNKLNKHNLDCVYRLVSHKKYESTDTSVCFGIGDLQSNMKKDFLHKEVSVIRLFTTDHKTVFQLFDNYNRKRFGRFYHDLHKAKQTCLNSVKSKTCCLGYKHNFDSIRDESQSSEQR